MVVKIISDVFYQLSKSNGNGGAIEITSNDAIIQVKYSSFVDNSASQYGGSIYCTTLYSTIEFSSFLKCYVSQNADNKWGNAAYFRTGQSKLYCNNLCNCGYSKTNGDSSVVCSFVSLSTLNASKNYGYGGSSSVSVQPEGDNELCSILKFMNVVDTHDNCAVESNQNITIYSTNFFQH